MMLTICPLLSAALAVPSAAYPTIHAGPGWSSDTLGGMTFVHGGDGKMYNSTQLALIARFQMAQFDKSVFIGDMPGVATEDRMVAAAKLVKGAAPHIKTLLYLQGLINFPASKLYNATPAALLATDAEGKRAKLKGHTVFNVSNPSMRALIVAAAQSGMATGMFDGVFIDRANYAEKCASTQSSQPVAISPSTCAALMPGSRQLLADLTAALGKDAIVLAKETNHAPATDWQVANAAMTSDTFCSRYCHNCNSSVDPRTGWAAADRDECLASMKTIANVAARGQLSQNHGMGPVTGTLAAAQRTFTIAAFLVSAGNHSYFSYADWVSNCWNLAGTGWWPEYDKPLGTPISPPLNQVGSNMYAFERNFSSGTRVFVDVEKHEAQIVWGHEVSPRTKSHHK